MAVDTISFTNQRKTGNLWPQTQESEYDFDPLRGTVIKAEFDSSSTQNAYLSWQSYVNQGIAANLRYHFGRATLRIVDSTYATPIDSWEMRGQSETFSPLLNPFISANIQNICNDEGTSYDDAVAALNLHIQANDDILATFGNGLPNTGDPALIGFYGVAAIYTLYPYILAGLTGYRNDANGEGYVLRHTTNVSSQSQENIADFSVGQIYSTAELLTEVQDIGLWANPLPEVLAYEIMNLEQPLDRGPNWGTGWIKGRSTKTTSAWNRVDIVQEYTFGQFELDLYEPLGSTDLYYQGQFSQ